MKMRGSKGFGLIEVLVTIIIISVGLLGVASLQLISLKNVNNTQFRTLATIYAYDMAERMRSNKAGVDAGAYNKILGNESEDASNVAQNDAFEWNSLIAAGANNGGLPSGVGTVTSNGSVYDIVISWQEQGRDNTGGLVEAKTITLSVRI